MKVSELFETAEDETSLQHIATEVQKAVIAAVAQEDDNVAKGKPTQRWGQNTPALELGKLGKLLPPKTLGKLHSRLRGIPVEVDVLKSNTLGSHDPELRDMFLQFTYADLDSDGAKKQLYSTIVHELRHALDTSKSKGSAYRNVAKNKRYKETRGRGTKPDADGYKANFSEINARTSEAMVMARDEIDRLLQQGQKIDAGYLKSIIFTAMEKKDITSHFKTDMPMAQNAEVFGRSIRSSEIGNPLDNKQFRRLFNRMYEYAQQHIKSKEA